MLTLWLSFAAIFYFDQSFTAYTKKKGRLILITHSPFEEWNEPEVIQRSPSFAPSEPNQSHDIRQLNETLQLAKHSKTNGVSNARSGSIDVVHPGNTPETTDSPETPETAQIKYSE